jgi:pimeloyl-ACP methyl ester carboxylesterase
MDLNVTTYGEGSRVVLVHGSMTTSHQAWERQLPLAQDWALELTDRRGYAPNPRAESSDFEVDGGDLAERLTESAHLVGHSYGGLGAIYAAAMKPDRVRSLTVVEPPTISLVRGNPFVEHKIGIHLEQLAREPTPRDFFVGFVRQIGADVDMVPDPLPVEIERQAELLMNERPPWEAQLPMAELGTASFPVLVVTGGWDNGLEAAADAFASEMGARAHRVVLTGRGHVVQRVGTPFNELLDGFLRDAEERGSNVP